MDHEKEDDREWVRRVQAGDTDAFEVLVRRHEKTIFNLLYRWLGDYDEASEAAQEVFLSAYRSLRKFRGDSRFSTWLYRIAVNRAKNRQRDTAAARRRLMPVGSSDPDGDGGPLDRLPHPGPDPGREAEQKELHDRIQRGLDSLRSEDAILILLHDLQDVSYEELVRILDLPLGTVKSRLHRARQALKAKLAPYFHALKAQK
jgi:RNA polymerase sigma-70 factor, ECF subfamily